MPTKLRFTLMANGADIHARYSLNRNATQLDLSRLQSIFADSLQEVFHPLNKGFRAISTTPYDGYDYANRANWIESHALLTHGKFTPQQTQNLGEVILRRLSAVRDYDVERVRQLRQLYM